MDLISVKRLLIKRRKEVGRWGLGVVVLGDVLNGLILVF